MPDWKLLLLYLSAVLAAAVMVLYPPAADILVRAALAGITISLILIARAVVGIKGVIRRDRDD